MLLKALEPIMSRQIQKEAAILPYFPSFLYRLLFMPDAPLVDGQLLPIVMSVPGFNHKKRDSKSTNIEAKYFQQ